MRSGGGLGSGCGNAIGVALASALVMASLYGRRRFFTRRPVYDYVPLEGIHGVDSTMPGLGDSTLD